MNNETITFLTNLCDNLHLEAEETEHKKTAYALRRTASAIENTIGEYEHTCEEKPYGYGEKPDTTPREKMFQVWSDTVILYPVGFLTTPDLPGAQQP